MGSLLRFRRHFNELSEASPSTPFGIVLGKRFNRPLCARLTLRSSLRSRITKPYTQAKVEKTVFPQTSFSQLLPFYTHAKPINDADRDGRKGDYDEGLPAIFQEVTIGD